MSGAVEWWSDASTVSQTSKASPLIICLRAHPEDQVFSSSPFSLLTFKSCMLCVHRLSAMYEYIACQDISIFTKRLARLETNNSLFPTQGQTLINCKAHVFSRLLSMYTQQLCKFCMFELWRSGEVPWIQLQTASLLQSVGGEYMLEMKECQNEHWWWWSLAMLDLVYLYLLNSGNKSINTC